MSEIRINTRYPGSVKFGSVSAVYSANGARILKFQLDLTHLHLDRHKLVSAPEFFMLQDKVDALLSDWDKKHEDYLRKSRLVANKAEADDMTADAAEKLEELNKILKRTLHVDDRVVWEKLKDHSPFPETNRFSEPKPTRSPALAPQYVRPEIGIFDILLGRKAKKLREAETDHVSRTKAWQDQEDREKAIIGSKTDAWQQRKKQFEEDWARRRLEYLAEQAARNEAIDKLAEAVVKGDPRAVTEHASLVLDASDYGDLFQKSFEIDYVPAESTLLVEYELPSPDHMPTVKSVKFVPATGELKETHISDREQKANFDAVCYQICLRTIHELFEADEHNNIGRILFNGYSTKLSAATGKDTRACIMSIMVKREEFTDIDLSRVDPKACFKNLKGVSASSLAALAPIPPVMEIDRRDKRFVEARNTVDSLSDETNLAAMGWEDFEHLIRELFEKEFASRGGEVKITQASSDGGVDAVAFDPDPITGGKIVIQAKRYTRTVGVAAVRDLFGTVMNEGASKGLLVTTADFGPDAHQFASGKPITLISGANLLHLLEKHGYRAKIDLQQARKELGLR